MPGLTESFSELLLLFIFTSALLWVSYSINKDERALSGAAPPLRCLNTDSRPDSVYRFRYYPYRSEKRPIRLSFSYRYHRWRSCTLVFRYSAALVKGIDTAKTAYKRQWLTSNLKWIRFTIIIPLICAYVYLAAGNGRGVTALERENAFPELVWHIGSVNGKI